MGWLKDLFVMDFGKAGLVYKLVYGIGFYSEEIKERGNREGARVIRDRGRGLWAKFPFFFPRSRTEGGGGGGFDRAAGQWRGGARRRSSAR
jgi:hypothetical protein